MGTANKITPELQDYIRRIGAREHPVLARCREDTHRDFPDQAQMQIAPEQGAFLSFLVRLMGARSAQPGRRRRGAVVDHRAAASCRERSQEAA